MTAPAFVDAEAYIPPMDEVPDLADVQYPCRVCGREAGPYGGRGPKPKLCAEHKTTTGKGNKTPRVTGNAQNLAAQATGVLVQVNSMLAMLIAGLQLFGTASAISAANEGFESAAYQALLTDPELCKTILKGGAKSAKMSLAIAYGGMAMSVVPTAAMELKERKAAKDAAKEEEERLNEYPSVPRER